MILHPVPFAEKKDTIRVKIIEKNIGRHENGNLYFVSSRKGKLNRQSLGTKDLKAARRKIRELGTLALTEAAVLISPEFWWMEAGISSDVMVKDNFISGSLTTSIQILARGGNNALLPSGAHRDISILNNRIENCPWPLMHVISTSDLTIDGNILPGTPLEQATEGKPTNPVLLENCENVKPARLHPLMDDCRNDRASSAQVSDHG